MLTLVETFLDSFDYSSVITRPMIDADFHNSIRWVWLAYQLVMKLVIVNIIAGLYIEQMVRSAAASDENSPKEKYAAEHVTFKSIEGVFDKMMAAGGDGIIP